MCLCPSSVLLWSKETSCVTVLTMQLLPTTSVCCPLPLSAAHLCSLAAWHSLCCRCPPHQALPLMVGWRGEGKGEPTVGLCSAELPAPIFVILCLCKFSGGIFKDVHCGSQHGLEGQGAEEERAALAEKHFRVEMQGGGRCMPRSCHCRYLLLQFFCSIRKAGWN